VQYLSTLEVCSRQGAIQIHVYLTLPYTILITIVVLCRYLDEALNNVSFNDTNPGQQVKLEQLLSYGLPSELQCLRSVNQFLSCSIFTNTSRLLLPLHVNCTWTS